MSDLLSGTATAESKRRFWHLIWCIVNDFFERKREVSGAPRAVFDLLTQLRSMPCRTGLDGCHSELQTWDRKVTQISLALQKKMRDIKDADLRREIQWALSPLGRPENYRYLIGAVSHVSARHEHCLRLNLLDGAHRLLAERDDWRFHSDEVAETRAALIWFSHVEQMAPQDQVARGAGDRVPEVTGSDMGQCVDFACKIANESRKMSHSLDIELKALDSNEDY